MQKTDNLLQLLHFLTGFSLVVVIKRKDFRKLFEILQRGFYVAKSCDPACPFDIVIVDKNGKIQLLDIKTNTYRKNKKGKSLKDKPKGSYKINRSPTKQQKKLGIKLMMVDYD